MKFVIAGALALAVSSPGIAQADLTYANPIAGSWRYVSTVTGSEASFVGPGGAAQLTLRCTRVVRRITIQKPAAAASATLWVWTSLQSRTLPASYDAATARVSADLSAFDGLLDALASSRGRIGVAASGAAPVVVPAWGDIARVVEDCRA